MNPNDAYISIKLAQNKYAFQSETEEIKAIIAVPLIQAVLRQAA